MSHYVVGTRAPAIPPDSRRLACGCGPGHLCATGLALWYAIRAESFGSVAWAEARQQYYRHVAPVTPGAPAPIEEEDDDADWN
jgi:hypothetical protein